MNGEPWNSRCEEESYCSLLGFDMAPYSLVASSERFQGTYFLYLEETLVTILYKSTRYYNTEEHYME